MATKNKEQLWQECVEELFALQEQVREDQKQFLLESATLIKASQKQLSEAVEWVNKARQSAAQSEQAAKEACNHAALYEVDARFWKRFTFWTGLGFFVTGVILALILWLMGQTYAERQAAVSLEPSSHSYQHQRHLNE